jgi:hypothetical protein
MYLISLQGARVLDDDYSTDAGADSIRQLSEDALSQVDGGDCTTNACSADACAGNICVGNACSLFACTMNACVGNVCFPVACAPNFGVWNEFGGVGGG